MKLLFSEYKSDYQHYVFPYAVWAIPEPGETPGSIFARGFLPSSSNFDRFYLCRHVRVDLGKFTRSSENRRILRKCEDISFRLTPRSDFDFTEEWRHFCKNYADIKFGKDIMTRERLERLLSSRLVTHLLIFTDTRTGKDVGIVTLYVEEDRLAYFYYSFYDLNYYERNLGIYIMTTAVDFFAGQNTRHMYLGTCYSRNALYKTQFAGAEVFNGFRWSDNLRELKYLIQRDSGNVTQHLVENEDYRARFYQGELTNILEYDQFVLPLE